jgi:hypothetical protein
MSLQKKALLVGINYTSIPGITLKGCINDVVNMSHLLVDAFDYESANITVLRDDINNKSLYPTRNNILNYLNNLVNQSGNLSEIWFHYSGHGSQVRDLNGDEADGLDEIIVPVDYTNNGFITDDEIFNIIKNSKCKTILLFDSCHSGSICDLQWSFEYNNGVFTKTLNTNKIILNPNIICFSGCKDTQTSADAYSLESQQAAGAFTDSFISCLRKNRMNVDILKLYSDLCSYINAQGFTQKPLLSCSSASPLYKFTRVINTNPLSITTAQIVSAPLKNAPTKSISIASTNKVTNINDLILNEHVASNATKETVNISFDFVVRKSSLLGKMNIGI